MDEATWLSSPNPQPMLDYLLTGRPEAGEELEPRPSGIGYRPTGGRLAVATDRKLRLFACACCRAVWNGVACPRCGETGRGELISSEGHGPAGKSVFADCRHCHGTGKVGGLTDPRSRRAVLEAERYADGEATDKDRGLAYNAADNIPAGWQRAAAYMCLRSDIAGHLPEALGADNWMPPPATQAALLREVCGNPWRPAKICPCGGYETLDGKKLICLHPDVVAWNDRTVPRIAQVIYTLRCWQEMPILADALLDAGCDDEDLLQHCRGMRRCTACVREQDRHASECECRKTYGWLPIAKEPAVGPHVRGCWALDLILGKS